MAVYYTGGASGDKCDVVEGDVVKSEVVKGEMAGGEVVKGEMVWGEVVKSEMVWGEVMKSEMVGGEVVLPFELDIEDGRGLLSLTEEMEHLLDPKVCTCTQAYKPHVVYEKRSVCMYMCTELFM